MKSCKGKLYNNRGDPQFTPMGPGGEEVPSPGNRPKLIYKKLPKVREDVKYTNR